MGSLCTKVNPVVIKKPEAITKPEEPDVLGILNDDIRIILWCSEIAQDCLNMQHCVESSEKHMNGPMGTLKERIEVNMARERNAYFTQRLECKCKVLFATSLWKTYVTQYHAGKSDEEVFAMGMI